ncbi:hypothetical protein CR513_38912, partial [Mucuna pruriens]
MCFKSQNTYVTFYYAILVPNLLNFNVSSMSIFSGLNFFDWDEQVQFHLGVLDFDLALLEEKHAVIIYCSSNEEKAHDRSWERSNRLSFMFMRMTTTYSIMTTLPETKSVKEFMELVGERYQTIDKSLDGTLISILTAKYGLFQMYYNTMKDKWNVHELHNMLVKEEIRVKNQGSHLVYYVSHQENQGARKKFVKKCDKDRRLMRHLCKSKIKHQRVIIAIYVENLDISRRIAQGVKAWFEKKGKLNAYIDFGCITHVSNTMYGFLTIQTISLNMKFVFMGNRVKAQVEAVMTYHLILDTGHHLDLLETLYVPSLSRNLVSLFKLDVTGYSFNFGNGCFSLFKHNHLIDGFNVETPLTLHHNVGIKRSSVNEHSTFLWHKHLGYISRERMERLVKNKRYFITFINDYSCYGYVYLLHGKFQGVDALEIYLNEVERQLDRKVKVVRSDRGDEYYKRYDETRQHSKCGICAQYIMLGTPQQNGVSERHNRTLMDMVRSILSNSSLPLSLWMYTLKFSMYLLNKVPSKAVPKIPFKLWTAMTPSLSHLHVWGCQAEIKIYNLQEKKLDPRTINGYFIGYLRKSKGYIFYCPNQSKRIFKYGNARFIENDEINGSIIPRDVEIIEVRVQVLLTCASRSKVSVPPVVVQGNNEEEEHDNEHVIQNEPIIE